MSTKKVTAHGGPGRSDREGLTVIELFRMFPNDAAAEKWMEDQRWPNGERTCPTCGSTNILITKNRKPMPYRCRSCREYFSVKKGTVMESSKIGAQKWAIAIYMMTTGLKGTSSMKVHRELGIRQSTAWFLMQRIREAFQQGTFNKMEGPAEADEAYMGGKEKNKHASKKLGVGGGTKGKTPVTGVKDRATNRISAKVVENVTAHSVRQFVGANITKDAEIFTDDSNAYAHLFNREVVNHSVGEYVRGQAHINGMESFWAMLKRGYYGTFHRMSPKHLQRYVDEFAGRHNIRDKDTVVQMTLVVQAMVGKRLRYRDLIA